MKKMMLILALALAFGLTSSAMQAEAQMGPGMMGPGGGYGMGPGMMGGGGYGGWYCPYCGQPMGPGGGYGMGPGMMGPGGGYGMGPGMMGPGGGYGMGPGMMGPGGGYGMGPGMMGPQMRGRGGMGPGMMGPGYGPQYGPQYPPQYQEPQKPMEEKDAKAILENYLASMRNPNLKLGKIKEQGNYFEGEILTKEGSLVDKIIVDKFSGWIRSIY